MAGGDRACIRVRVEGRVQGVFYRASVQRRAAELGLGGWVRNCPDGSVELEAEGPETACQALVAYCRQGPPAARVEGVQVSHVDPQGHAQFEVRY